MSARSKVLKVLAKLDPPPPTKKTGKNGQKKTSKSLVKKRKEKPQKIDGWSAKNIAQLRSAIRQVWSWSEPCRIVRKRCLIAGGFSRCEQCKKKVPKVFVDHIKVMGSIFGEGYIERMGCPSTELQGLCKKCHDAKTAVERKAAAQVSKIETLIKKAGKRKVIIDDYECPDFF